MKIYIYWHTHWDREWYFTEFVSQNLLQHNLNVFLNLKKAFPPFYLDGQWSILEDYLQSSSQHKQAAILKLLQTQKIITGPWYIQPDFFNSLGASVIRNLQLGEYYAKKYQVKNSKIVYCPDSFGFGANLPQIFNYFNYNQFLFWRGCSHKIIDKTFIWNGINNYQVKTYCLQFGYFILGHYLQWEKLTQTTYKDAAKQFVKNFFQSPTYQKIKAQNTQQVLLGCGHDQAPIYQLIPDFFQEVNRLIKNQDYEFILTTHEQFFQNINSQFLNEYYGNLDYGYISKIHRTIASSRYDFKKNFRDLELILYHQLEPLHLKIAQVDPNFDNTHQLEWNKQLIKLQAHDTLGGCVSDPVHKSSMQHLKNLSETISAEKDYYMSLVAKSCQIQPEQVLVFNPQLEMQLPNINKIVISTSQDYSSHYFEDSEVLIYAWKSQINLAVISKCYLTELVVVNKNLKPFTFSVLDLKKLKPISEKKILGESLPFEILVEKDLGDTYDFDPDIQDKQLEIIQPQLPSKIILPNFEIQTSNFYVKSLNAKINIIILKYQDIAKIYLDTFYEQINSCRVSLKFTNFFYDKKIKYLQNLAMLPLVNDENINWKELNYKENPVNIYRTNGLITNDKKSIVTYGTNEFWFENQNLVFTLFRAVSYLGKANLNNRPGPISGLASKTIQTPEANLIKTKLEFEFDLYNSNNLNATLNASWKKLVVHNPHSLDVEESKIGQFILDPEHQLDLNKNNFFLKNHHQHFIACSWINFDSLPEILEVNLNSNQTSNLDYNQFKISNY